MNNFGVELSSFLLVYYMNIIVIFLKVLLFLDFIFLIHDFKIKSKTQIVSLGTKDWFIFDK